MGKSVIVIYLKNRLLYFINALFFLTLYFLKCPIDCFVLFSYSSLLLLLAVTFEIELHIFNTKFNKV